MKKLILSILMLSATIISEGTIHTVNNSGFTFVPPAIQILAGDTVDFSNIDGSHNAVEVSQANYNSNQGTPLPGGFSAPFGGSMIFTAGFSQGMHYYVCQPHVSLSMKGTINVVGTVGIAGTGSPQLTISALPNPFNSSLAVAAPGIDVLEVYTVAGQKIRSIALEEGQSTYNMGTASLSNGLYIFRFFKNGVLAGTRKLVKD